MRKFNYDIRQIFTDFRLRDLHEFSENGKLINLIANMGVICVEKIQNFLNSSYYSQDYNTVVPSAS